MKWMLVIGIGLMVGCGSETAKKTSPSSLCGNGAVDGAELCDPAIEDGQAGACPTSCAASACEVAQLVGSPDACTARCLKTPVACSNDDGCCPAGCDRDSDSDCTNSCGDGVVEGPETCDGDCPTTCPTGACLTSTLTGSAALCNVVCETETRLVCEDGDGCCPQGCTSVEDDDCMVATGCGNGVVDPGELCDGNCPTTCAPRNACETARLEGFASSCNVSCEYTAITQCSGGDGCCPNGCTSSNDSDCSALCGNGVVDAGESCDGNCPSVCTSNNACIRSTLSGNASQCTARCVESTVTQCASNDGCCPAGCTSANDNDCACVPRTCAQVGAACGTPDNGCGQPLQCPACPSNQTCSSAFQCVTATTGLLGAACAGDVGCGTTPSGQPMLCIETDPFTSQVFPGGYCSTICIPGIITCEVGVCSGGSCLKPCTSNNQCRLGYQCASGGCAPI